MARLFLTLLLLSALSSCLAVRPLRGLSRSLLQQPSPGASLRWSEEFNALDTASWNVVQGDGTGTPPGQGWGNGEAECYTNSPNNVRIVPSTDPSDSGNSWLSITALKQNTACNNGPSQPVTQQPWSSAKLTTQTKRSFMWTPTTNLRVEARIKIPASAGTWPAFWMLPEANEYGGWCNSGEIDIMEHINGLNRPIHGTLHYGGPWPTCIQSGGTTPAPTLTSGTPADWHVYAVEWAPEYLAFSMDGVEYYRVQRGTWWSGSARGVSSAPFDRPFYLILNLAIGGAWPCPGGMCDGTPLNNVNGPFTMLVDYIRVWDVPAGADRPATPSPTPSPLPSPQPFASPAPVEPVQPTTYPVCMFTAPCPQGTFYFCQAGGNANGCSTNPFPAGTSAVQCSQQCLSVKPTSSSPTPLPTPSPSRATSSPSPATPSDSSVSPYPSCSFVTPCPQGRYFYCQAGGNFNGCSANPFPAGTGVTQCSQQCLSIK